MSYPKLYKSKNYNEIIACVERKNEKGMYTWLGEQGNSGAITSLMLEKQYELISEAPKPHSTAWAWQMLEDGHKICRTLWTKQIHVPYIYMKNNEVITSQGFSGIVEQGDDWKLYEEPKPIVECLPHEFVKRQDVLVPIEGLKSKLWKKGIFECFDDDEKSYILSNRVGYTTNGGFRYCLPYAGNEHIEGQVTDGYHGKVPEGYVPPRVPKLGDDDYWQIGDSVVVLHNGIHRIITSIYKNKIFLNYSPKSKCYTLYGTLNENSNGLRVLYHKGSYVKPDGTVHEHVPTRPYRIETE